jgi:NADH dehydrogenase
VAYQQGVLVAKQLKADLQHKPRTPFVYFDKGQMATIGRRSAVLQVGALKLHGLLAWMAWLFVHVYYLIGFRNRLFVLMQWAWYYVSFSRGARLIVQKDWKSYGTK